MIPPRIPSSHWSFRILSSPMTKPPTVTTPLIIQLAPPSQKNTLLLFLCPKKSSFPPTDLDVPLEEKPSPPPIPFFPSFYFLSPLFLSSIASHHQPYCSSISQHGFSTTFMADHHTPCRVHGIHAWRGVPPHISGAASSSRWWNSILPML